MLKFGRLLRSMRFGIVLLALIGLCSVIGSVIPQGREMSYYVEAYPGFHGVLLLLKFNNIFYSWYFVLLASFLGLNLTLCSLVRIVFVAEAGKKLLPKAAALNNTVSLSKEGVQCVEQHLKSIGCKKTRHGNSRVYSKNLVGRYGSFITHLSILLVLVFGAAGLYLPVVTDEYCLPGEAVVMEDGTRIDVNSFYIENSSGQLDFTSDIRITDAAGRNSKEGSIKVNYPMSLGPYKVYQQNYATAGQISVTNLENGGTDSFVFTEVTFVSLDGINGLWYLGLYPDYYLGPDGEIFPVSATYGRYENPVYFVQLSDNGQNSHVFGLPGESVQLGGLEFRYDPPVEYPGLRIKYTPPIINALLFFSFGLMILGLYITFFMQPVIVKVDDLGYAVAGPKPEGISIDLQDLLEEFEKGDII